MCFHSVKLRCCRNTPSFSTWSPRFCPAQNFLLHNTKCISKYTTFKIKAVNVINFYHPSLFLFRIMSLMYHLQTMRYIPFKYAACRVLINMYIFVTTSTIECWNIHITSEISSLCSYLPTYTYNYCSVFSHHRLFLPALEILVSGTILYTHFFNLHSLTQCNDF